jgi:Glutamyl-tRNAGlu reductase, dimerisation domain
MSPPFQHLSQKLESIPRRGRRLYDAGSEKESTRWLMKMKRGLGLPAFRQALPASWPPPHARRGGFPYLCASTERVRARETERVLRKLDLSQEQVEVVERLSRSLVEKLVQGPITKVTAIIERTDESQGGREA